MSYCEGCDGPNAENAWAHTYAGGGDPAAVTVTVDLCEDCESKVEGYTDALRIYLGTKVEDEGDHERDMKP